MKRREREDLMAALMCGYLSMVRKSAPRFFSDMGVPFDAEWLLWPVLNAVPGVKDRLYTSESYRRAIARLEAEP